jgi:hypothetical protein
MLNIIRSNVFGNFFLIVKHKERNRRRDRDRDNVFTMSAGGFVIPVRNNSLNDSK